MFSNALYIRAVNYNTHQAVLAVNFDFPMCSTVLHTHSVPACNQYNSTLGSQRVATAFIVAVWHAASFSFGLVQLGTLCL